MRRALRACVVLAWLGCGEPRAEMGAGAGAGAGESVGAGAGAGVGASAGASGRDDVGPMPQPSTPARPEFSCEASASTEPEGLRRLTMTQYRNTLRDLTRWVLGDVEEADAVLASLALDALPADRRQGAPNDPRGGYRRLDQALDQSHVDGTFEVAVALGRALGAPERLAAVVGACATNADTADDEACVTDFVARFGARALRRPLDAEDGAFYRAVYGSDPAPDPAAYADVIAVMLSSPELLYFVEHGEAAVPDEPGRFALSAHELASRLSYHFWQTLPDEALFQAAEDGSLLEPATLDAHVDRLLADPRARETMAEWFTDLLGLGDLPALDAHVDDPVFAAFAGADRPGPDLRQHAIDEALDLLAHYTWTDPAGVEALFTSELSFARSEDLARLYGVAPWDGSSPPPELPAGTRPGLLTRTWFLASGSASTRPIQRGVLVRRRLLCDELPPPPASVNAVPPPLRADKTTRAITEELTEQPGTVCASCHATAINPLGFAFEGFDALGRVRGEQPLFADDGTHVGALPIDTRSVPRVTPDDASVSHGPADLMRLLLQSGKLEACLARQYFRFTFGRNEDLAEDGCALERLRGRLAESGRLRDLLKEAALLPEQRTKRFTP